MKYTLKTILILLNIHQYKPFHLKPVRSIIKFKNNKREISMIQFKDLDLFDFDANLLHKDLKPKLDEIILNANMYGVKRFGVPGTTIAESTEIIEMVKSQIYDNKIIATCGVHPYNSALEPLVEDKEIDALTRLIQLPECLAVGECGLDYSEGFPSKDFQLTAFETQLKLASTYKKPLYLHVREAHQDFKELLHKYSYNGSDNPTAVAIHCFTGTLEELSIYVSLRFYIGLTGYIVNNYNLEQLKELLHLIPDDKLLIETDAPYMGFPGCLSNYEKDKKKQKKQKYPNVPSSLPIILQMIAEAKSMSIEDCAELTTNNAMTFFGISSTKASS